MKYGRAFHLALMVSMCILVFASNCFSEDWPPMSDMRISVGGNWGRSIPGKSSKGGEVSFSYKYYTGSAGIVDLGNGNVYSYGEASAWFLLSVGLGVGMNKSEKSSQGAWHYFVGIPIPVYIMKDDDKNKRNSGAWLYAEPYWRSILDITNGEYAGNEIGALLKLGFLVGG